MMCSRRFSLRSPPSMSATCCTSAGGENAVCAAGVQQPIGLPGLSEGAGRTYAAQRPSSVEVCRSLCSSPQAAPKMANSPLFDPRHAYPAPFSPPRELGEHVRRCSPRPLMPLVTAFPTPGRCASPTRRRSSSSLAAVVMAVVARGCLRRRRTTSLPSMGWASPSCRPADATPWPGTPLSMACCLPCLGLGAAHRPAPCPFSGCSPRCCRTRCSCASPRWRPPSPTPRSAAHSCSHPARLAPTRCLTPFFHHRPAGRVGRRGRPRGARAVLRPPVAVRAPPLRDAPIVLFQSPPIFPQVCAPPLRDAPLAPPRFQRARAVAGLIMPCYPA